MTVEVIRDAASLPGLADGWADLWTRSDASPFQHPAWLLPWWEHFAGGPPRVAVMRGGDGRLIGLLAMYDLVSEGKILPIGVGLSDYCDALLDRDAPPGAAEALLQAALLGCTTPCHLPDLPPGAALRRVRAVQGRSVQERPGEPCPVLLPPDIPARQRRKLRMARHRAERSGGFAVIGAPDREALLEHLIRLHGTRWQALGEPGVLADPRVRAFHRAAVPALATAALLRLRGLYLGDAVVATIYALHSPGRLFCYLSGFDAARAFESPGTILLGAMIDEAVAENVTEVHFLRGAEPYKYAWGATDRRNATLILEPE